MHSILIFIYLLFGGVVGGLLSTMASIASLATYPILLSIGISPVFANTTNDAALIWTGVSSALSSPKELKGHWKETLFYAIFAVIGSFTGCMLLIHFPGKVFQKVVPFCIAFSGILILFSDKLTVKDANHLSRRAQILAFLGIVVFGIYGGYFGAAAGILLLSVLNIITAHSFLTINAMKNIIAPLSNLTALIIYSFTERIYWSAAIPIAIGMFIGGYLGPKILHHIPVKLIRIGIATLALLQAAYYAYTAYFK